AAPDAGRALRARGGARLAHGLPALLDGLERLQRPGRGQQREPHPGRPHAGQLPLRLHRGAVPALHAEQPLRRDGGDGGGAVVPLDGGLRARAAPVPGAGPAVLRHLLDAPRGAAHHPGAALYFGQGTRDARQLRRPDRAGRLQRVRDLPASAVLHRDAQGARRRRLRGRVRLLGRLLARDTAPEPAHPGGAGGVLFSGELEQLPLAAHHHPEPGPVDDPGGHIQLPDAVRRRLELHHGRGDRGRHTDDGALLRLPAPARRVHKDLGLQV
ncbi:MAG: ABC transporter, permease protein 2 (cluster 1, maltose/g3p/polyamine/iron), partial [uncultured Rubrobacteraceae bacterium]